MYKWAGICVCIFTLVFGSTAPVLASSANYKLVTGETISDPTRPANWRTKKAAKGKQQTYKLNYILNADERKQAIVNGKKVTVGDWVAGAKVLRINDSGVVLSVDGQQQTLRVNKIRQGIKSVKN